jgi:hypothetical protein
MGSTTNGRRTEMEILSLAILIACIVALRIIYARVRRREAAGEIEARLARYCGRRI